MILLSIYMDNLDILKQLGLSNKEILVYTALLNSGSTTATVVAKESGVKRSSVYFILNKLIGKGLVSRSEVSKKELFQAEEPDVLVRLAKEQSDRTSIIQKSVKELVKSLRKNHRKNPNSPRIRFFEGLEGIWNIAEDTLKEKKEIFVFGSSHALYGSYSWERLEEYGKRRIKHRIRAFILTDRHPKSITEYFKQAFTYQEYHFLPETIKLGTYFLIYGDKAALISSKQPPVGIIIEDKLITDALKVMFMALWNETAGKNLPG